MAVNDPNSLTPQQKVGLKLLANRMALRKMQRQAGQQPAPFPPMPGGLPNPGQVPPPVQAQVPPPGTVAPGGLPGPGTPSGPVSANQLPPQVVNQIAAMMAQRGRMAPPATQGAPQPFRPGLPGAPVPASTEGA